MTGNSKPGEASADKLREEFEKNRKESDLSLTRLEVRAEMKSAGEEELSGVIEQETLERQRKKETDSEAPSKASPTVIVLTVARKLTPLGATLISLAAIAAYVAIVLLKR